MEQERCNTMEGIFTTLNNKFKPQYNKTIKSLQFCKLGRHDTDNKSGTEIQSEKTTNMCHNALKTELQLLGFQPSMQAMPGLWEEVCRVWQDHPLQRGLQKWEK